MKKLAIFASGSGTNAQNIIEYFGHNPDITIECVLSNKKDAPVLKKAEKYNVQAYTFTRDEFYNSDKIINFLKSRQIDFIVLAGFLWLVPGYLIQHFQNRIINIHPALLPKYGGKGMYGMKVHESVLANKENETGITIHYVNEQYDEGDIIFQAKCNVEPDDTPESVAQKVHELEYKCFPEVIEKLVNEL